MDFIPRLVAQRIIEKPNAISSRRWTLNCKPKADIDDVSGGSNPAIYTFFTLILDCLLLNSDTWHLQLKKPLTLKPQGSQTKNDPTWSEQLTAICSDWVGSFILVDADPSNPNTPAEESIASWEALYVLFLQEVKLYAVVILKPSGSSQTVTELIKRSMIIRLNFSSFISPSLKRLSQYMTCSRSIR